MRLQEDKNWPRTDPAYMGDLGESGPANIEVCPGLNNLTQTTQYIHRNVSNSQNERF